MSVTEHITNEVNSTRINREHLIILLNFQFQIVTKIGADVMHERMQEILVIG